MNIVRNKIKTAKLITVLFILVSFIFVSTSFAVAVQNSNPQAPGQVATPSAKLKVRDKLTNRLDEVKLKVCQKKQATIRNRSRKLVQRAENIQSRFNRIVEKVDEYYVDKVLPAGVEINNYDQMLDRIDEKRAVVASSLGLAGSTADNFDCEGRNPKEQLKQFGTDMHVAIGALKDYKKSVIDLLVAVRTKAKNIKSPVATGSAQPATGSAEPAESNGTE